MHAKAIKLANELVEMLERGPRNNMLARWMAHYLAEQMTAAEAAEGPAKIAANERCFNTVLALWKHRGDFPDGLRPFEDFEPIFYTLQRLNPDAPAPFFHGLPENAEESLGKDHAAVLKMVKFVESLDVTARILMSLALQSAVKKAASDSTRTMLMNALPGKIDADVSLLQRLLEEDESSKGRSCDEISEVLERQLKQLDWFMGVCEKVRSSYSAELKAIRKKPSKKVRVKK